MCSRADLSFPEVCLPIPDSGLHSADPAAAYCANCGAPLGQRAQGAVPNQPAFTSPETRAKGAMVLLGLVAAAAAFACWATSSSAAAA